MKFVCNTTGMLAITHVPRSLPCKIYVLQRSNIDLPLQINDVEMSKCRMHAMEYLNNILFCFQIPLLN